MNLEARLWSLLVTFDSDKTLKLILKLIFIRLSLKVKVLGFRKEEEFKEEKEDNDDGGVNKVMLVITVEHNI